MRNAISTNPTGKAASRAGLTIPEVLPGNLFNAPPDITITGFSNIGIGAPNPNANNVFEWKDDLSHIAGNHNLQIGFDILRLQKFDRGNVETKVPSRSTALTVGTPPPISSSAMRSLTPSLLSIRMATFFLIHSKLTYRTIGK